MPSGVIHYKYFKKGYLVVIPITIALSWFDLRTSSGFMLGYSLGRWIDPDWDLMSINAGEGRLVNEIPILGHVLFGISSAYGSWHRNHHRSFQTHFPIYSTFWRLVWLLSMPFAILDGYGINFIGGGWHVFWLSLWLGLSIADGIHWYLDKNSAYYSET